ncbi:PREDICTED: intestinal mucin-like protein, partial [Apaloderma vittatum]|uniref:intestinal mucin-like protein n=1 Tax=Apaloderma vittatum TaxID=57397 RepID=UPI0005214948
DVMYHKVYSDGCKISAICSTTCTVERHVVDCNVTTPITTTSPVSTTVTPPFSLTTTPPYVPPPGCVSPNYPPLQPGQKFKLSNCTEVICKGNHKTDIQSIHCPPVKEITCANKYPPILVPDKDGCCYHYECQCVCSGWGDPHYITFDGTYYTFLENCTYVLVKQIVPKYDNFRVYVDNYYCDSVDGLSCPKSIIIFYKSAKVVLTRELLNGVMTNVMYFNNEIVHPGFKKDGISFSMLGINMIVEIPEIGATITFSGLIFSVKLPFDKFGNNTEGQCGTCTNNKADECRLPSGKIISSCPEMAHHWIVDNNQTCHGVPLPHPVTTPPPRPHCETPPLCKLILSKTFADCHGVIPPEPFFQGCVFDGCRIANKSMQCSSLEIYATECAARGVCIDWRRMTNDTCSYHCPASTVYKPCGPINPATCDKSAVEIPGYGVTEGCFCPEGKTLLSIDSKICVRECREGCAVNETLYPPGAIIPSQPCEECICSKSSSMSHATIKCKPVTCDTYCPVVGEFWHPPGDNCTTYTCEKHGNQYIQVALKKSCPAINPDCNPDDIVLSEDGCCKVCSTACLKHRNITVIEYAGCVSPAPVELSYCEGRCDAYSRYSLEANTMEHKCSCCQETKVSQRKVTLTCSDGTYLDHAYTYVEQCSCSPAECVLRDLEEAYETGPSGIQHEAEQEDDDLSRIYDSNDKEVALLLRAGAPEDVARKAGNASRLASAVAVGLRGHTAPCLPWSNAQPFTAGCRVDFTSAQPPGGGGIA